MIVFSGKVHLTIGLFIEFGLLWLNTKLNIMYIDIIELVLFTIMLEFGCIFPDIDKPNSIVGRKIEELSIGINIIFGHRGIFHNVYFYSIICGIGVLILVLMLFINSEYSGYWLIGLMGWYFGVISHIVGDRVESIIKRELRKQGIKE